MGRENGTFNVTDVESAILDMASDPLARQASYYNTGAKDCLIHADGVHRPGCWVPLAGSESAAATGQPRGITLGDGSYPLGNVQAKCNAGEVTTLKGGPVA